MLLQFDKDKQLHPSQHLTYRLLSLHILQIQITTTLKSLTYYSTSSLAVGYEAHVFGLQVVLRSHGHQLHSFKMVLN